MFSSTAKATAKASATTTHSGWKWEVNHDGVIWSWSHPTPTSILTYPIQEKEEKKEKEQEKTEKKEKSQRPTLVDYWYTVHDGTVIPNNDL